MPSLERRDEYILELCRAGCTTRTIEQNVNANANKYEWPAVSIRQIQRIIAKHYTPQVLLANLSDHQIGMREATFAQYEKNIERMMRYIVTKRPEDWKPFELAYALRVVTRAITWHVKAYGLMQPKDTASDTTKRAEEPPRSPAHEALMRKFEERLDPHSCVS